MTVASAVELVSPEQKQSSLCDLLMERGPGNDYSLHGCVTRERRRWPLNFAVNDTAAWLGDLLRQALDQRGMALLRAVEAP